MLCCSLDLWFCATLALQESRDLCKFEAYIRLRIMEIQTSGRPIDSLLEKVLCMNILSSDYFKELYRLKTYHEVIDEIYNQVDHVEPWMTGNCRGPSTAFCLLYKFFTMKLTVKQMHGLLKHPDSPYIRAVSAVFPCLVFIYACWIVFEPAIWNVQAWAIWIVMVQRTLRFFTTCFYLLYIFQYTLSISLDCFLLVK